MKTRLQWLRLFPDSLTLVQGKSRLLQLAADHTMITWWSHDHWPNLSAASSPTELHLQSQHCSRPHQGCHSNSLPSQILYAEHEKLKILSLYNLTKPVESVTSQLRHKIFEGLNSSASLSQVSLRLGEISIKPTCGGERLVLKFLQYGP